MQKLFFYIVVLAPSIIFAESNCSKATLSDFERHLCLSKKYEEQDKQTSDANSYQTNRIKIDAYYRSGKNSPPPKDILR